jgi:class 3 adenylate cyclase/tetratricopeptide (TPR) repeat protein
MPACPSCGQDNPAIARYCLACGTELRETPAPIGPERKVVTVLFCDLVGFTTRSHRSDPEDIRATLSSYFTRLRQAIERFGGTAEKFIGDAVVAVFGAPVAHEDDPERALRCSFAMLRAIDELNEATPGLDLAVRIGIATGETLVVLSSDALGEGIVTGDVVNTAARLQEVAPIGGTVVAEATYRATKLVAEYDELEPVLVKGKAEPLHIWRPRGFRSRYGADVDREARTPFIGREDELELLRRTFHRALREPSIQLVTIMGEPGVGKSRLVREFFAHIDTLPDLIHWRHGRCLPYGEGITYWALGQIVKAHAGILESDAPEAAAAKLDSVLEAVLAGSGERDWIRARLGPLVGVAPASPVTSDRSEMHAAWRAFFEAVASVRPLVLVLEDLHWADIPMLEFIEHLVGWSSDVPMLVLCTARPELFERRAGWAGGQRNSTTISLAPLSWEDTASLVSALLSEPVLPLESRAALMERSGGNPLYAEEFAQMVREGDLPPEFTFPDSVHALIAARLDALPPPLKGLLQDASVIGKVFWSGALRSMSDLDEQAVHEGLHELTRRELVRPIRVSSVKDEPEFGFWHVLIGDVAYGEIPRAARADKHRAVAGWIERLIGGHPSEQAELLAYHYSRALELAEASRLDAEVPMLRERLLRSLLLAGEAAMGLEIGRAADHYARALDLLPEGHPDRGRVLARAAVAAARCGRFEEAEREYEAAIALAEATGTALEAGDAMVGLAGVLWHLGAMARTREVLDEGISLLEGAGPSQELARAYTERAFTCATSGLLDEAVTWSNRALEMAGRLGLGEQRAQALAFRGGARCELGDLGGLDDLQEALSLTSDLGLAREAAQVQSIRAGVLWGTEGPEASLEAFEAGIELAERRGITDMSMSIRSQVTGPLFDLGGWDRVLETADQVMAWFQAQGGGYFQVVARTAKARVETCRGLVVASSSSSSDLASAARAIGDVQVLIPGLAVAALEAWVQDDVGAAVALVEELQTLTTDRSEFYLVPFAPDLVRLCVSQGKHDLARRVMGSVRDSPKRNALCVTTCRALLEEAAGRFEEAAKLHAEAASGWKEYGSVPEHGYALLGEGRCLVQLGRPGASDLLGMAGSIFESLGAGPPLVELEPWATQGDPAPSAAES